MDDLDEDEARYYPRFFCLDCRTDTCESGEYYMVSDSAWAASVVAPNGGMLCLACLEKAHQTSADLGGFHGSLPYCFCLGTAHRRETRG
jgi:hypothetical protein